MLIDCNCLVYKQEFYWSKPGLMTDIKGVAGGTLGRPQTFEIRQSYAIWNLIIKHRHISGNDGIKHQNIRLYADLWRYEAPSVGGDLRVFTNMYLQNWSKSVVKYTCSV